MAIGPFESAAGQQIQPSADIVRTSGFATSGRGAALYVYDASVNAAFVAAHPRTSFIAANGRGFRLSLDQTITPFMFGAVGVAAFDIDFSNFATLPDDTAALQAFFTFCATFRVESCNWGGIFGVAGGLVLGDTHQHTAENTTDTMVYQGALMLMVKSAIGGAVLTVRNRRSSTYGPLTISSFNTQAGAYSTRIFDVGLHIHRQSQMQVFTSVVVHKARVAGIYNDGRYAASPLMSNTYQNRILNGLVTACGSGGHYNHAAFNNGISTTTGGRSHSGDGSHGNQRTSLRVGAQPPSFIDTWNLPCFVRFSDDPATLYKVMSRDPSNNSIQVYPWVSDSIPQNATLEYVCGGGLVLFSGDSGMMDYKLACNGNAFGVMDLAVYGTKGQATMQFNACGYLFGNDPGNVHLGHSLNGYWEGNDIDFFHNALGGFTISSQVALDPQKIKFLAPRVSTAGGFHPMYKPNLQYNTGSSWLGPEFAPDIDGNLRTIYLAFDAPYSAEVPLHADNPAIYVGRYDGAETYNRLFGYRARKVVITGTGPNNAPSGTLTVAPRYLVSAGNWATDNARKINRGAPGAAATFSGFTGPVTVQAALDPSDPTNYLVSILGGRKEQP